MPCNRYAQYFAKKHPSLSHLLISRISLCCLIWKWIKMYLHIKMSDSEKLQKVSCFQLWESGSGLGPSSRSLLSFPNLDTHPPERDVWPLGSVSRPKSASLIPLKAQHKTPCLGCSEGSQVELNYLIVSIHLLVLWSPLGLFFAKLCPVFLNKKRAHCYVGLCTHI